MTFNWDFFLKIPWTLLGLHFSLCWTASCFLHCFPIRSATETDQSYKYSGIWRRLHCLGLRKTLVRARTVHTAHGPSIAQHIFLSLNAQSICNRAKTRIWSFQMNRWLVQSGNIHLMWGKAAKTSSPLTWKDTFGMLLYSVSSRQSRQRTCVSAHSLQTFSAL